MASLVLFAWGGLIGLMLGLHLAGRKYREAKATELILRARLDYLIGEQANKADDSWLLLNKAVRAQAHKTHTLSKCSGVPVSDSSRWVIDGKPIKLTVEAETAP